MICLLRILKVYKEILLVYLAPGYSYPSSPNVWSLWSEEINFQKQSVKKIHTLDLVYLAYLFWMEMEYQHQVVVIAENEDQSQKYQKGVSRLKWRL